MKSDTEEFRNDSVFSKISSLVKKIAEPVLSKVAMSGKYLKLCADDVTKVQVIPFLNCRYSGIILAELSRR